MNENLRKYLYIAAAVVALGAAYYYIPRPSPAVVGETKVAAPAKEVLFEPLTTVAAPKGVKVYRAEVKTKLRLPKDVVDDAKQQVISTAKVPNDDRPHTVSTVINTETGEAISYVRTDPLPWIAKNFSGELGMYAGYKNGTPTVRIAARQSVLDIKAVRFGVVGSVDQQLQSAHPPEYFIGVGAWYRW